VQEKLMLNNKPSPLLADLALVTVTIFWGSTFIISKLLLAEIPLVTYLVIRLNLAAILLTLYVLRFRKEFNRKTLYHGILLGIFLFLSYVFQMWGIKYTSASNAGFITGLNVVFVPLFSIIFFGDHPKKASIIGVIFATFGLYFLSGGDFSALTKGDWLVFVCAVTVTFHVIYTGKFARKNNIYLLTAVQLCVTGILSLTLIPIETQSLPPINLDNLILLIYLALFGTIYTFLMQTAMQRFTTATRTALVFSLEPVFAALFAFIIAGEILSSSGWLGGILIICGMLIAEINWERVLKK
jgi:drug/metabolite transporter (DMT)-like permease